MSNAKASALERALTPLRNVKHLRGLLGKAQLAELVLGAPSRNH
jgi:hypothetical protein